MRIDVTNLRPTSSAICDGDVVALDCQVRLELGGRTAIGDVTLTVDRNGDWVTYGDCAEAWVEQCLLDGLSQLADAVEDEDLYSLLTAVAAAATDAAARSGARSPARETPQKT